MRFTRGRAALCSCEHCRYKLNNLHLTMSMSILSRVKTVQLLDLTLCSSHSCCHALQTTYNPMQEPSGVYQYTYNQAADLMDDADSSYAHQNSQPQQWAPRQEDALPAVDPFTSPAAQRAASSPADERKVMKFVSKEVSRLLERRAVADDSMHCFHML